MCVPDPCNLPTMQTLGPAFSQAAISNPAESKTQMPNYALMAPSAAQQMQTTPHIKSRPHQLQHADSRWTCHALHRQPMLWLMQLQMSVSAQRTIAGRMIATPLTQMPLMLQLHLHA